MSHKPRDPEGYTFGWKIMDETVGPNITNCPGAILDLLDPPTNQNARLWRERCRAREDRIRRARDHLKPGVWIELEHRVRYRKRKPC